MQRDRGRIDLDLVTLERSVIIASAGKREAEGKEIFRPSVRGGGGKKEKKKKKNGPRLYNCSFPRPFFFNQSNQTVFTVLGVALEQMLISLTLLTGRERERERERNLCNSRINTEIRLLGARWTGTDICARALRPTICR